MTTPLGARRIAWSFVAGGVWGVVAWLLARRAVGDAIWIGVMCAPFIGVAVTALTHRAFVRAAGWHRSAWALTSLYLGATLFGLALGLYDLLYRMSPYRAVSGALVENVLAMWWGVTLTGFFIVLWPLAYLTHFMIESMVTEWQR